MIASQNAPIFIVGAPRSGTTLLSAMLSNHSNLCCGPESQFFNKINVSALQKDLNNKNWIELSYKHVDKITLGDKKVLELFQLSQDEYYSYLYDKKPCISNILDCICGNFASKYNKPRWVEKTPGHILYLNLIRELFPNAYIIRIIRDPRDSTISMKQLPWTSHSFIENSITWKGRYLKSEYFLKNDTRSITIKYEDLIKDTQQTLKKISNHIEEDFQESMLDTSKTGIQVSTKSEPWKNQVSQKIDNSRISVWKHKLPNKYKKFSAWYFQKILIEHNYPLDRHNLSFYNTIVSSTQLCFRKLTMLYKKIKFNCRNIF